MKCERESVHACVSEHKVGWLSDSDCQDVITHTHTYANRLLTKAAEQSRAPDDFWRLLFVAAVIVCVTLVWTRVAERSQRALDFSQCRTRNTLRMRNAHSVLFLASFPSIYTRYFPQVPRKLPLTMTINGQL